MNRWLVKSDPDEYSAADLERDRRTVWDGVTNALAQRHIRAMAKGDAVLTYHSGKEKAVVATAKVAAAPRPEGRTPHASGGPILSPQSSALSPAPCVVELAFDRWLKHPVTLAAIKADPAFKDFALVRISRLSVMPVTTAQWDRVLALSND